MALEGEMLATAKVGERVVKSPSLLVILWPVVIMWQLGAIIEIFSVQTTRWQVAGALIEPSKHVCRCHLRVQAEA